MALRKKENRNYNADIVLIDIISFSTLTSQQQLELITYLTKGYRKMLEKLLSNSDMNLKQLILGIISTGDGFYCILNPKMRGFGAILALSFNHFAELITQRFSYFLGIRTAVHTGEVFEFTDILGNPNFVGDGLNHCARFLEYKEFDLSTVFISSDAFESFNKFLMRYPDFKTLLLEQQFKRSREYKFNDKHGLTWAGYLVWLREGSVINPPNLKFNSLKGA